MSLHSSNSDSNRIYHRIFVAAVIAVGLTVPLVSDSLDDINGGTKTLAGLALWTMWAIVLLCVLVPSPPSLTALRLIAPMHTTVVALVVVAHPTISATVSLVLSITMTASAFMAEIGSTFVQRSAYGDELRFPLRSPIALTAVQISMWVLWFGSTVIGSLALMDQKWVIGGLLVTVAVAGLVFLPRRFHRMSRRWLVRVPAGIVIHDHVVLAETAMFGHGSVQSAEIVHEVGADADLTGGGRGDGIRVTLTDFDTMVLAATRDHPGGRAIHVKSFVIRPSRPGRTLRALRN